MSSPERCSKGQQQRPRSFQLQRQDAVHLRANLQRTFLSLWLRQECTEYNVIVLPHVIFQIKFQTSHFNAQGKIESQI
jgi:hypothetical protein